MNPPQILILGYGCQIKLSNICFSSLAINQLHDLSLLKNMTKKQPCSEINAFKNSDPVDESLRRTGLHLSLSEKSSLTSPVHTVAPDSLMEGNNLLLNQFVKIPWRSIIVCLLLIIYFGKSRFQPPTIIIQLFSVHDLRLRSPVKYYLCSGSVMFDEVPDPAFFMHTI
jgi:hypothetical protein